VGAFRLRFFRREVMFEMCVIRGASFLPPYWAVNAGKHRLVKATASTANRIPPPVGGAFHFATPPLIAAGG